MSEKWNDTGDGKNQGQSDAVDSTVIEFEARKLARTATEMATAEIRAEIREKAKAKARAKAEAGDKPPTFIAMYRELTAMMNGQTTILPPPRERLIVATEDDGRTRRPLRIDEREVCWDVTAEDIAGVFTRYCHSDDVALRYPSYATLEPTHCEKATKHWRRDATIVDAPVPFRFASEPGACYHRADFDPTPGPTPLCDALFARMTNASVVKAFIGSLFDEEADRQQHLWLHGQGRDGKGALVHMLANILGPGAVSLAAPPARDKHWAWTFVGKRLIIFPDLTDERAMSQAEMKSVTGGDRVSVNPKFGKPFDSHLRAKIFSCSNGMPRLMNNRADRDRIIFAEMLTGRPLGSGESGGYDKDLAREAPAFIADCLEHYAKRTRNHGEIRLDVDERKTINAWAELSDDLYAAFFEEHFVIDAAHGVVANDVVRRLEARDGYRHGGFTQAWYAWLRRYVDPETKKPVDLATSYVAKVGKKTMRVFYGWRLRTPGIDDKGDVTRPHNPPAAS